MVSCFSLTFSGEITQKDCECSHGSHSVRSVGGHTSPCSSEPRCHTDNTAGQSLLLSVMQTAHALSLTEFTAPTHVAEQYSLAQSTFLTQRHYHQSELGFAGQCCSRPEDSSDHGPQLLYAAVPFPGTECFGKAPPSTSQREEHLEKVLLGVHTVLG